MAGKTPAPRPERESTSSLPGWLSNFDDTESSQPYSPGIHVRFRAQLVFVGIAVAVGVLIVLVAIGWPIEARS
jgi:hypothetical protein